MAPRASDTVQRGFALAIAGYAGKLARPAALLYLARSGGIEAVGSAVVAWEIVEIAARVASLGAPRALQRMLPAAATAERAPLVRSAVLLVAIAALGVAAAMAAGGLPWMLAAAVPVVAVTSALLAVRPGVAQIRLRVLARGVVEPVGFAVVALAGSRLATAQTVAAGYAALLAAAGAAGAIDWRARGVASRALLRTALPLWAGEVMQVVTLRADLLLVRLLSGSPAAAGGYAIARELIAPLALLRDTLDDVLAPLASRTAATLATRWAVALALPIAAIVMLGGTSALIAWPLALLVLGRLADLATAAPSIVLAMRAAPSLSAVAAFAGLVVMLTASLLFGATYGATVIALGPALGLVTSNLLARRWLAEDVTP